MEIEHIIPDLELPYVPVTACMEHKALLTGGLLDIFSWDDCTAGGGDYPCGSQPSLELTAVKSAHGLARFGDRGRRSLLAGIPDVHRSRLRSDDLGPVRFQNNMVLQPEEVVVQVPDSIATRKTESGNTVWSTVDLFNLYIRQNTTSFDSSWSGFKESVTVSGVGGAGPPGRWRMGLSDGSFDFLDATSNAKVEGSPYDADLIPVGGFTNLKIDFGALGTYVALFEIEATKSGTTYPDSGTYTFHVGPVAELEVRDDPAHSLAEPGRRAYTIVARNHGPDTAPAVQVTLSGVPKDAETISSRGEYVQGTCNEIGLCTGVWSLGEMLDTVSASYVGLPDGEVLTIIPAAGGSGTVTATIENTRDYSVTIDGTTHWYRVAGVTRTGVAGEWSYPVSATTDGDPTEAPREPQNLRVTGVNGRQVSLAWDPPQDDGGSRVTGYEYRAHGPCAHDRSETCEVVGTTRTSGTSVTVTVPNVRGYYDFDVRARNVAGAGWWAAPLNQYVDPGRTWRVSLSPSSLTVNEGGEATYRVKLTSDPGRPVMVALWWDGDDDLGNTLAGQQFKWLLPSNWQDPDGHVDPEWSYAWNVGVLITVTERDND